MHTPNQKMKSKPDESKPSPSPAPPALVDFMLSDWGEPSRPEPKPVELAKNYATRRRALSRAFPGEVLIIPTGHERTRSADTSYRFRPGSDFFYLTGNTEPDCVLVLLPRGQRGHEHVLFVAANKGRTDSSFFLDRQRGELWVGPRFGVPESKRRYQVDRCAPLDELGALTKSLRGRKAPDYRLLRRLDADLDRELQGNLERDAELSRFLSEMRIIKDADEIAALERAARATRQAFDASVRALQHARNERDIETAFDACARREGNDVGFATIAAAGPHASILHWTRNDGALKRNQLLLIDAGVEGHDLYTADVSRTLPVGGRFTKAQRELYELVLAAQKAAIAAVKPGADFVAPHRASLEVLTRGLCRLGILAMPPEEALADDRQFHKRYTLHNTSHMLGLDVHDNGAARPQKYREGKLLPGMVITVEPGLYFQENDLTVPARYRGIGIRIEDDVLVTSRGHRVLTRVPKETREIERWMQSLWRGKKV